jgi:hypothetical protein
MAEGGTEGRLRCWEQMIMRYAGRKPKGILYRIPAATATGNGDHLRSDKSCLSFTTAHYGSA